VISIFDADQYTIPVTHKISTFIREYDISKANINILLFKGLITLEKYNELYNMNNGLRKRVVGLMQRNDRHLSESLMSGFGEARHLFYRDNDIREFDILSVKKDAIFLIDRVANVTKFGNIEFKLKNEYTSFYNLPNLEIYYMGGYGYAENIEIKGIGESQLELHRQYFIELLLCIFASAQKENVVEVVNLIRSIMESYINGELGVDYYREFNNRSLFRTYYTIGKERAFLKNAPSDTNGIDPSYNYGILQFLYKIFMDRYLAMAKY